MERVNKDTRPIYYKNAEEMDKPLSELMEGLRMEIDKTRGKMHDMKRSYGWADRIEPLEGGLTCMLMAMYGVMMEFKDYEDKQRAKAEKV
jgi:NifU-like protein involved in Fe-S cluster formation